MAKVSLRGLNKLKGAAKQALNSGEEVAESTLKTAAKKGAQEVVEDVAQDAIGETVQSAARSATKGNRPPSNKKKKSNQQRKKQKQNAKKQRQSQGDNIGSQKKGSSETINISSGPINTASNVADTVEQVASNASTAQNGASGASGTRAGTKRNSRKVSSARKVVQQNADTGKTYDSIMKSNAAINKGLHNIYDFASDGVDGLFETGRRIMDNPRNLKGMDRVGAAFKDTYTKKDGTINMKKAAASYVVANSAIRAVSGGGIYKDGNGRTDIVGIPFV